MITIRKKIPAPFQDEADIMFADVHNRIDVYRDEIDTVMKEEMEDALAHAEICGLGFDCEARHERKEERMKKVISLQQKSIVGLGSAMQDATNFVYNLFPDDILPTVPSYVELDRNEAYVVVQRVTLKQYAGLFYRKHKSFIVSLMNTLFSGLIMYAIVGCVNDPVSSQKFYVEYTYQTKAYTVAPCLSYSEYNQGGNKVSVTCNTSLLNLYKIPGTGIDLILNKFVERNSLKGIKCTTIRWPDPASYNTPGFIMECDRTPE